MPHHRALSVIRQRPFAVLLLLFVLGSLSLAGTTLLRQDDPPRLSVTGELQPGEMIHVIGNGFAPGEALLLTWDGEPATWLPTVQVGEDGSFDAMITLPPSLGPGPHTVGASDEGGETRAVAEVTLLESDQPPPSFEVAREPFLTAPPTPSPTPTPSATPELDATVAPTTVATAAPVAAAATPAPATPRPTAAPPAVMPPMAGVGEHGSSLACSGYPEQRIWLESQDWWSPIPELGGLGHMHMGMCFPLGQTVSGAVVFDVRVVLHHNAGTLVRIKMQDDNSKEHIVLRPNQAIGDGTYWYKLTIDTRNMPDGLRLFRFYADLEHPNGNTQTARPILPLRVENGGADSNWSDRDREVRATAWYREASPQLDWGYVGAVVENFNPGPYHATAAFQAKCFVNGEGGGESQGSPAVSSWSAHVDADFHAGNEGIVIGRGNGQLSGGISVATGGLSEGWHRLVVKCNQALGDRTHSAVGIYSFLVDH